MRGATIWITGLSGSGKTTLAGLVAAELHRRGRAVEVLDGDAEFPDLCPEPAVTVALRDADLRRIGFVANLLSKHGVFAIISAVGAHREIREHVRATADGRFFEVYLATPLAECAHRDVRGLYAEALAGRIAHFPGVTGPYEPPLTPELTIMTHLEPPDASVQRVIEALDAGGYL